MTMYHITGQIHLILTEKGYFDFTQFHRVCERIVFIQEENSDGSPKPERKEPHWQDIYTPLIPERA